jgi:predicted RNA-binding protein with TRAM domain
MCPSSGELTVSMRHWYFALCMGEKYQCRIDTVSSADDGHIVVETYTEVEINIPGSSVHLVGFI